MLGLEDNMAHLEIINQKTQSGFLLLEVLIAILVFSLGVLAIAGLQANMVKHTTDGQFRAIASQVAEQRIADRWTNPSVSIVEADTDISAVLPAGMRTVVQVGNRYEVTVTWQQPGGELHQFTTVAYVDGN